jgi:photosystem II stability/assembly factor-like uncharacterized protein
MVPLLAVLLGLSPSPAAAVEGAPCWIEDAATYDGKVWLLCDRERVLIGAEQGKRWRESRLPSQARLRAIALADAEHGFIAGDNGTLLTTADGGRTWRTVPVPTTENLRSIALRGASAWIAGYGGTILHSPDGGATWTKQISGATQALESVFFLDAGHGWAAGWTGAILRTVNGGQSWEQVQSAAAMWSLNDICFRDPENGWAVGMFGQVLRSRDGGATWQVQETPVRSSLTSVYFDDSGKGYVTGESNMLVSDDGESWRAEPLGERLFPECILNVQGTLWAVGPFGVLIRQADGWRVMDGPRLPS